MDALERLESVHLHLCLLQTHGIATRNGPSNRFLAEFLLLLGQSSSSNPMEMDRLCGVLMDAIPKIRATSILHEASNARNSGGDENRLHKNSATEKVSPTSTEGLKSARDLEEPIVRKNSGDEKVSPVSTKGPRTACDLVNGMVSPMVMVGIKDMERARSTVEDFCRSYFMFHEMDVQNPKHVFQHFPLLVFVESYIYQLDEVNEDQMCPTVSSNASKRRPLCGLGEDPFAGLRVVLSERGLLTKRIEEELSEGLQYWKLEHSLCAAISDGIQVKLEDVVQALRFKSFDYRILNLLMYGLRNVPVDEAHFEFLSVSELLVEVGDDLFDYEEDVGKNCFNVLRLFLHMYGPREAATMLAKFIGETEDKYQVLMDGLDADIGAQYRRRCEEAVREGGNKSLHVLGSWTIPPLIVDEDAFRMQINEFSTSTDEPLPQNLGPEN